MENEARMDDESNEAAQMEKIGQMIKEHIARLEEKMTEKKGREEKTKEKEKMTSGELFLLTLLLLCIPAYFCMDFVRMWSCWTPSFNVFYQTVTRTSGGGCIKLTLILQ